MIVSIHEIDTFLDPYLLTHQQLLNMQSDEIVPVQIIQRWRCPYLRPIVNLARDVFLFQVDRDDDIIQIDLIVPNTTYIQSCMYQLEDSDRPFCIDCNGTITNFVLLKELERMSDILVDAGADDKEVHNACIGNRFYVSV